MLLRGKNVFFRMLSLYTNGMGSFVDVVWVVFSVKKTIRGVSYRRGRGKPIGFASRKRSGVEILWTKFNCVNIFFLHSAFCAEV